MRPQWVIIATFGVCAAMGAVLVALDPPPPQPPSPSAPILNDTAAPQRLAPDVVASTSASAAPTAPPRPAGPCADDMILVEGFHCPFVAHVCKKQRKGPDGACDEFEPRVLCEGTMRKKLFCIDRYEYPNQEGVLPVVLIDFADAERACDADDKRLCTVDEWQLACEGEAILPYTTGTHRTKGACNWDARDETPVIPTRGLGVPKELGRLDGRAPSGTFSGCKSPFGVVDMGGNVAEWTRDPTGSMKHSPFASIVAGGAFGKSQGTCRALDADGAPSQRASTLGVRCCADPFNLPTPNDKKRSPGGFHPLREAAGLP